ncbi:RDD family protein [Alkalisalibacterium limincola]|uniref:RDD family protein n=1 Tax=Alkalisalibacterium limincola TaxID=2699169 RepID=A0A5C8KVP0_9GAMM|nr:RDD family protein [Alkalisalibacterium limincola]TXK64582.1 RDD family protein [Alkalisalibacterium limincola]
MQDDFQYVGFWARVGATVIDVIIILCITVPLTLMIYGFAYYDSTAIVAGPADILINWIMPAVAVILLWLKFQATPGKMVVGARVVDARTGATMTPGQAVVRYLAYIVSALPLLLGYIWISFDSRKQGWHDKIAGTIVIRPKVQGVEAVKFGADA